jgi:uncharacterized protein (TIGR02996 family)
MARKLTPKTRRPTDPPPGPQLTDRERTEIEARLARMLSKPIRSEVGDGRFYLLWTARNEAGAPEPMMWTPETKEELRGANLFFEAANNLGAFAKPVQKGKPVRRSPEHAAFIAGILANRDDDTGYLAYADYLTEHGNSQGDLIRLCIERDKLPPDGPEAEENYARLTELCEAHLEEWFAPLGELGLRPEIYGTFVPWLWIASRTGVIERVTIDRPGVLPQKADRLFAAAPFLRRLEFERGHLDPAGLARVKQLTQIEELELFDIDLTAEDLGTLLRSKYLTGLKVLNVGGNEIGDAGAAALARWPGLEQLESLDVSACGLTLAGLYDSLLEGAGLANLTQLRIGRNQLGAFGAGLLFDSPFLKRLVELELGGTEISPTAASSLEEAAFAGTLHALDLDSATFQPSAFEAFARCRLPALQALKLNNVAVGAPGAEQLAQAQWTGMLQELQLDNCRLGMGAAHLFRRGKFSNLTALDISRNRLGRTGVLALARAAKNFPALTHLRLWDNRLSAEAVQALATSKVCEHLTNLDLSVNNITPRGALALANSKYLTKLGSLVVDEKAVGKKGKQALLDRFGERVVSFR